VVATRALIALAAALCLTPPASPARADDCVVVDDFAKGKIGEFPPDWKPRKDSGRGVYSIQEENGRRFLHAASKGLGIQAAKQFAWDLAAYPVLAWDWRPIEFPKGGDERKSNTNDSVLSVYAVFPHTMMSLKSLKYIWSEVVPVGTRLSSNVGLTQVLVVKSGTEGRGQWAAQRANVLEDYRKFFETSDVPKPEGIAVLTDSDDTKSSAQGDYANFRVCKP
jgi:Protein of unknown function (DUF3047)